MDVLIVEDADAIRSRLRQMFVDISGVCAVHEAADISQARELLSVSHPAVVVLDLRLRGGSGLELLKYLKQSRADVCVIVMTNDASDHHRRSCELLGADYFFDKSSEFEAVLGVLEREARMRQASAS